jgi:branched-chain amino acid transport system ATP-binding protein
MLAVEGLDVFYGDAQALDSVELAVGEGAIVAIVGANGAGKTTLIRAIAGILKPARGRITFRGADITGWPSHRICNLGIGQVAEGRQLFPTLTVAENLEMGAMVPRARAERAKNYARALALFPILAERARQPAGTLSGGEQQMLAIGRALMAAPKILLLDEPSMGLAPILVEQIFGIIKTINEQGTTILLVEQNALMALGVADRGYILQTGEIVLTDTASALAHNEAVQKAYLGGD